jgi:type IV pilus assembly protein PilY1
MIDRIFRKPAVTRDNMKTMSGIRMKTQCLLLLTLLLLLPSLSRAASMNDYCVVPAFIGENVPANLLLMIDNSSSMYDLTYADQGQTGHCATTTSQACQSSTDCPVVSGTTHESCTGGRAPYYCIDESYRKNVCSGDSSRVCGQDSDCVSGQTCTNVYAGYFSSTVYYSYDLANNYFSPATYDATKCTKSLSNTLCVGIDATNKVNYFGASGNYLNWLASSKFDVQKRILTGGKDVGKLCSGTDQACDSDTDCAAGTCTAVATSFLQAESRGCLGQGFTKIALAGDFTNYASTSTDPNSQLGIVFLIKGPKDSIDPSAPSRGGQSYIEIYNSPTGTTFNNQACQQAIDAWASGDKQGMSTYSSTCIGYNASVSAPNYCYANHALLCPNNTTAECVQNITAHAGGCSNDAAVSCWDDSTCGTTTVHGTCDNPSGQDCTTNSNCQVPESLGHCSNDGAVSCKADATCGTTPVNGYCTSTPTQSCTVNVDCNTGTPGYCSNKASQQCALDSNCTFAAVNGTCSAGTNGGGACTSAANCPTLAVNGVCSAGTNAGGACTSAANCPTLAVNGVCSAGTNAGGACTSAANCPTLAVNGTCSNQPLSCTPSTNCNLTEVLGTCQVNGTSCRANGDCAAYCSGNDHKSCDPVGSSCSGSNGTCVSDVCQGYRAASTGSCVGYTAPGTAACSGYTPAGTAACSGYTPAGTAACNGYVPASTGTCAGFVSGVYNGPCIGASTVQNTCVNYQPATTGTCTGASITQNTCSSPAPIQAATIDYGPCVNPSQSLVVKTKTAYTHTINTCSQYLSNGQMGNGDVSNFENGGDCVAVYSAGVCSNAPTKGCAKDSDCSPGTCVAGPGICLALADNKKACAQNSDCSNNICTKGPAAILPGNAAQICSMDYLGAFYTGSAPTWAKNAWSSDSAGQLQAFKNYCAATQPTVIDPTSATTTDSINYQQTPAMLGDLGVEGQLGSPIGTLPVRLKIASAACTSNADCTGSTVCSNSFCVPSGLIQQFGSRIRIGAMSFNFNGSKSEAGVANTSIVTPQCCSNDTTKLCTLNAECGSGTCGTCDNKDGGQVIYPIGRGKCATMTTTTCVSDSTCGGDTCINGFCGAKNSTDCATDAACASGDTCMSDPVGDHATAESLINKLDRIRANAWTPFAEAFYNAVGYFAVQKVCDNSATTLCKTDSDCSGGGHCSNSSGKSRTDLRINSGDYKENLNPSQYICQQNYTLLITDGSSTADQNSYVRYLAVPNSGNTMSATAAGTCSYYAGSTYAPTISWLGRNMNISSIPPPTSSANAPTATVKATQGRDSMTTYVVSTGGSNGQTGECNSVRLLTDTAANGGSTLKQANNPQQLASSLQAVFEELAAKSASGTAASILSNSEGSGANILQAIFFPRKVFDNQTEANWLGELNNLWYFVDPFIGKSSTREDTDGDNALKLKNDYVLQFGFDNVKGVTTVKVLSDTNGDGAGDTNPGCVGTDPRCVQNPYPTMDADPNAVYLDSPDNIRSLWKSGKQLWSRDLITSPRTIYTPSATGLMKFSWSSPDNSAALQTYLQYPTDNAGAVKLMEYVHGFDYPGDSSWRSRTVQIGNLPGPTVSTVSTDPYVTNPRDRGIGVWKLGDIISSTPRLQSTVRQNAYDLAKPSGYGDVSYSKYITNPGFTTSNSGAVPAYQSRGKVYVGANDGMLHAFNLGILDVSSSGDQKASLSGTGLGNEAWAFIPTNVLPYLKYYADPNYSHLYFMDGNTTVVDASVGKPDACTSTNYWDCAKDTTTGTNWRSILVGGMGIGGASRDFSDACLDANGATTCVKSPIAGVGVGYSSYYALDVSNPDLPKFLWEFNDHTGLGFATSGAAIVKIDAKAASGTVCSQGDINIGCSQDSDCNTLNAHDQTCIAKPDSTKNGRWFAVFGSGPMGPIDTAGHAFKGTSNQPLKVYVVDLNATPPFVINQNYWIISDVYTGTTSSNSVIDGVTPAPLDHAFSGSMVNGAIDVDRWNTYAAGNYQDDAVYFGYSQESKDLLGHWAGSWTTGGVLKLVTFENPDPSQWKLVKVIDGIGPVTTAIGRLQDRKNHKLWLYFGTGRYYYLHDDFDTGSGERIYGIQDQCYRDGLTRTETSSYPVDTLDPYCTTTETTTAVNQTAADQTTISRGWYINLDQAHLTDTDPTKIVGGERVITDPVALTNGAVFFSSYKPNNDFCQYGGLSYLWATKFDTGTQAPAAALNGKALVQVSTGQFKEVDLATAFTDPGTHNRRMSSPMTGKPPTDAPPIVSTAGNKPVKRILHIQER